MAADTLDKVGLHPVAEGMLPVAGVDNNSLVGALQQVVVVQEVVLPQLLSSLMSSSFRLHQSYCCCYCHSFFYPSPLRPRQLFAEVGADNKPLFEEGVPLLLWWWSSVRTFFCWPLRQFQRRLLPPDLLLWDDRDHGDGGGDGDDQVLGRVYVLVLVHVFLYASSS